MSAENDKIDGDLIVSNPITLHGMVTGKIVVRDGGLLILQGICCRNLEVETGGTARIQGIVSGNIINHGGKISIEGIVKGSITCPKGITEIDSQSQVMGGIEGTVILTCNSCSQKLRVTARQHNLNVTCPNCKSSWLWKAGRQQNRKDRDSQIPQEVVDGIFNNFGDIFDEFFKQANVHVHTPQHQQARSSKRTLIQIEDFLGKAGVISMLLSISLVLGIFIWKGFNLSQSFVDSTAMRTCATLFCGGIISLFAAAILQTIRE
jgi:predicted RNA-binding Zn-ribbon protein involved in translation (DUF1610 family)